MAACLLAIYLRERDDAYIGKVVQFSPVTAHHAKIKCSGSSRRKAPAEASGAASVLLRVISVLKAVEA